MYLLDTNIISLFDPRRREIEHAVIEKLQRIEEKSYFSVLTLTEIESGILIWLIQLNVFLLARASGQSF